MAFDGKQLRNVSVDGALKLIDASVTGAKLANATITATQLADDSVFTAAIQNLAVTTAKLADTAVTTGKLADDSVTTVKILAANVTLAKLASNSVDSSKIVDGSVTGTDIASATITGSNIASNTVAAANLVTTYENGLLYIDGTRPMTGSLDLGTTHQIINLANPVGAQDAATKFYVDSVASNLDLKASVRVLRSTPVTLAGGAPDTVDSVALALHDRILVTGQTTASENGIYEVTTLGTGVNGTWARTSDANLSAEVTAGMFTFVEEGTVYSDTGWVLVTHNPITLGSTSLAFTQFSGAGSYLAGFGLTLTGNSFSVVYGSSILSVGDANAAGSSNTSARGDHVHAHGTHSVGTNHAAVIADAATDNTTPNGAGTNGFETSARALKVDASPFGYQGKATGDVDLNTAFKIINLADPASAQDAATKAYVDTAAAASTSASTNNKWMTASLTTTDGNLATATAIATTPKGYVQVFVNGQEAIWTGTPATSEVYFTNAAGSTNRTLSNVVAGDKAHWNGSVAGYQLATTDVISFDYIV